jgi:hypothetical protein
MRFCFETLEDELQCEDGSLDEIMVCDKTHFEILALAINSVMPKFINSCMKKDRPV